MTILQTGKRKPIPSKVKQFSSRGFTLIEILLVIVILGVLTGFALPNFSKVYTRFELSEAAKNLASFLRYAQTRAVIHRKTYQLAFDSSKHSYQLKEKQTEGEESEFKEIAGRYGKRFFLPEGVMLTFPGENPFILFYPDGKIDNIHLYLSDQQHHDFTVSTQEQVGHVQIFDFKAE